MPIVKQPKEDESFNAQVKMQELEETNKKLIMNNWVNSLQDEKVFRLELLQAMERITEALNALTSKVVEITTGEK